MRKKISAWNKLVKKVHNAHPHMKIPQVAKLASKSYHKKRK